ncbi:hypothetical protein, partial [Bifidobacterium aesculapii]|uniref:hypothetical protein n=1 Tax=Bifidobacterium aesculapii TaxID=1329411 RepID=UPI001F3945AD
MTEEVAHMGDLFAYAGVVCADSVSWVSDYGAERGRSRCIACRCCASIENSGFLSGGKYGDYPIAPYFPPLASSQRRKIRSGVLISVQTAAQLFSAAVITEEWGVLRIFRRCRPLSGGKYGKDDGPRESEGMICNEKEMGEK